MNKNSGTNNGFFHQGDNYDGCVFVNEAQRVQMAPESLYKKKPRMNLFFRWTVSVISLLADIIAILSAFSFDKYIIPNTLQTLIVGSDQEKLLISLSWGLFIFALFITFFLFAEAYSLTFQSRYGNLRRTGNDVFLVKPGICPLCGSKLKLVYRDGNYLECSQNPGVHSWSVSFPIKKQNTVK